MSKSEVLISRIDHYRFLRKWDECVVLCNKYPMIEGVLNVIMIEHRLDVPDIFKSDRTELQVVFKVINASNWSGMSERYQLDMKLISLKCLYGLKRFQELLELFLLMKIDRSLITTNRGLTILAETYHFCAKSLSNLGLKADQTGTTIEKFYKMSASAALEVLKQHNSLNLECDDLSSEMGPYVLESLQLHLDSQISVQVVGQSIQSFREIIWVDSISKLPTFYRNVLEKYINFLQTRVTTHNYSPCVGSDPNEEIHGLITSLHKITPHCPLKLVDYYVVLFAKCGLSRELNDVLWSILSSCPDNYYVLHHLSLTLVELGRVTEAMLFLWKCHSLDSTNVEVVINVVQIIIAHNISFELLDGFTSDLLRLAENDKYLKSRAYVYRGIYHMLSRKMAENVTESSSHVTNALKCFREAHEADPNDFLPLYHTSLHSALQRRIGDAFERCFKANKLQWQNKGVLSLYVLLLTADGAHHQALEVLDSAIGQFPTTFVFFFLKTFVESEIGKHSAALNTCSEMLAMVPTCGEKLEFCDVDFLSKLEGGGDLSSVEHKSVLEFNIWLRTAQIFLDMDKLDDVASSLKEAENVLSGLPSLDLMKARLARAQLNLEGSIEILLTMVALEPRKYEIIYELGLVYLEMGRFAEAENYVRGAISIDSLDYRPWGLLGRVLECVGDYDKAASCYIHAHHLRKTAAVLPFSYLPLLYR